MVKERSVHGKDALKRKDASVVKHGQGPAVPQEHWFMDVSKSVFATGSQNDPKAAFLAKRGQDRVQPHTKINECDH